MNRDDIKFETKPGTTTAAGQVVTITITRKWVEIDRAWAATTASYKCSGCGTAEHVRQSEDYDQLDAAMKAHASQCRKTPAEPRSW